VAQNAKIPIQDGRWTPHWKILEMLELAYLWTGLDETWVIASHHVPDMWLPWQQLLLSNDTLNIQQLWASGGRTREPILTKFGTQQQITTSMTVT